MTDNSRANSVAGLSLRTLSRAALGCMLGATLLAAGAPARAADDDKDNVPLDTKIIRGIMEQPRLASGRSLAIDYEERPPLVIPPNHDLPPPERTDAALTRNPAWPVDPDVKRREAGSRARAQSQHECRTRRFCEASRCGRIKSTPGPKPRTKRRATTVIGARPNGSTAIRCRLRNSAPRAACSASMFGKDEPESGSFTGEPPRAALTEPPSGYQTPSPDQPYGVGKAKPVAKTSTDYMMDHPVGSQ